MRMKMLLLALVSTLALSLTAFAEEGRNLDAMTMEEIKAYVKELEQENQSLREQLDLEASSSDEIEASSNENDVTDYVKDYTGRNLLSVGYTSMGGDRRDYCGKSNLKLILIDTDGSYIDPKDDEQLQLYTVVSQNPPAGQEVVFSYDAEDNLLNRSYNEIVLVVQKAGEDSSIPELTEILPSMNKETQYMKEYVGRNLETVGYTAMNGNRYDTFGTDDQRIQITISDEDGNPVDPSDTAMLKYYIVTSQNIEPNSELRFSYSKDADGEESITGQTVSLIQISARITEAGQATIEQNAAEEEELRASGALRELYTGIYKVGEDLEPGNYTLKQISDSASLNIYLSEEAYNNEDGDWEYLYGADDVSRYALREGMYLKVDDGAVKAIRSEFPAGDEGEMELFAGLYRVGTDITAGSYEITQIGDSCSVNLYQSEEAYKADDGKWDYLYGKGDVVYYSLLDGMVLKISDGAVTALRR